MARPALMAAMALLLSACASVPISSVTEDASAKRFDLPPPDKSALYIFRQGVFNAAFTITVSIGQRTIGPLASDTFFRLEMAPGDYEIRCTAQNTAAVPVRLAPNGTSFVEIAARIGVGGTQCATSEVSPTVGHSAILRGRRAQEVR
jgi:hypothetical protein